MKELSIEEKAKAYDKVVEKFKYVINQGVAISKEDLQDLFPELKESDDEIIYNEILDCFKSMKAYKWINWLERHIKLVT